MRYIRTILLTLGVSALLSSTGYGQTPFEPGATPMTLAKTHEDSLAERARRDSIFRETRGPLEEVQVGGGVAYRVPSQVAQRRPGCGLSGSQLAAVRTGVGAGFIAGNAYLYHYFKKAWWSGERAPHFFFHADWDQEFRDQDKFGHLLGGYHLARIGYLGLREACVSDKKAIIWSAAYAAAFQIQIEIFDGQFKKYGFSYADVIANTTGQTLAVLQELHPRLRAIKPTFSYHETRALKLQTNGELRPSLDYAGQTYWFSTDVHELLPDDKKAYWPSFVRFSVGHSVTDWVNSQGVTSRGKRKLVLSLDLDPSKLPGDAPLWRSIKNTLSFYHFPAPALQLTPRFKGVSWYR